MFLFVCSILPCTKKIHVYALLFGGKGGRRNGHGRGGGRKKRALAFFVVEYFDLAFVGLDEEGIFLSIFACADERESEREREYDSVL